MSSGTLKFSLNLDPCTPYLWFLLHQNTSNNIRKYMGTSLPILFVYIWTSTNRQFWKRRAPENDEDLFNEIFKILKMGPIST